MAKKAAVKKAAAKKLPTKKATISERISKEKSLGESLDYILIDYVDEEILIFKSLKSGHVNGQFVFDVEYEILIEKHSRESVVNRLIDDSVSIKNRLRDEGYSITQYLLAIRSGNRYFFSMVLNSIK